MHMPTLAAPRGAYSGQAAARRLRDSFIHDKEHSNGC
jgi:hypothetical protein